MDFNADDVERLLGVRLKRIYTGGKDDRIMSFLCVLNQFISMMDCVEHFCMKSICKLRRILPIVEFCVVTGVENPERLWPLPAYNSAGRMVQFHMGLFKQKTHPTVWTLQEDEKLLIMKSVILI